MSRALTLLRCASPIAFAFAFTWVALQSAHAQTFTVLHNFTGGVDGKYPGTGTLDSHGNFYGTTEWGGTTQRNCDLGCGTVFKLSQRNGIWILSSLYNFTGGNNGWWPQTGLTFGPDGSLYGTTYEGGDQSCSGGCGTVFKLQPPLTFCRSILCPWNETILHRFTAGNDGANPSGVITFDPAGNLYGTTPIGGQTGGYCGSVGCGLVYELSPSNGGWTESILYAFAGALDGEEPVDGVVMNSSGDLFGTSGGPTQNGYPGAVYELTPSGSGWSKSFIYVFQHESNGTGPVGLIMDSAGNLYGATMSNGPAGGGTVYELSSGGGWNFTLLYGLQSNEPYYYGPETPLTMDAAGNLYGTTAQEGQYNMGSVFKLTPAMGSWIYTSLHDFSGGNDGGIPGGRVLLDSQGNVYGTTLNGGLYGYGVAFKIAQ